MHKRLKKLLKDSGTGFCIQYILASFGKDKEDSSRLFIAAYQKGLSFFSSFLDEWYRKGRSTPGLYYKKYLSDFVMETVEPEWERHKAWQKQTGITSTPTVLFDGYPLPENYKVEDLIYFRDLSLPQNI
jgi:hypothetical protein